MLTGIGAHGIALLALAQLTTAAPQTIDRLMAVVAGEPIFLSDVREVIRLRLLDSQGPLAPPGASTETSEEAMALDRVINRKLVSVEVARYSQVPPPEAEIAAAHKAWAARFDGAPPAHDAALVRAFLIESLRITRYVEQRFATAAESTREVGDWLRGLRDRAQVRILR